MPNSQLLTKFALEMEPSRYQGIIMIQDHTENGQIFFWGRGGLVFASFQSTSWIGACIVNTSDLYLIHQSAAKTIQWSKIFCYTMALKESRNKKKSSYLTLLNLKKFFFFLQDLSDDKS